MNLRNRKKNAGRLMSKWDMVTYASRKVGKSLILQGQILKDLNFIHSVGEAIGKFLVGLK